MKRTLDLDDVLQAPLEIQGWYLDATVKARVEAMFTEETFDAHDEYGDLKRFKTVGDIDPRTIAIDWLEVGPTLVCKNAVGDHCIKLDPESIPVTIRRQFEQAVEAAVILAAKNTPHHKWSEGEKQ